MMDQEEVDNLATTLTRMDQASRQEAMRQAEEFLKAQLTAGIAADQRAVTFSSVLTAIITAVLVYILANGSSFYLSSQVACVLLPLLLGLGISVAFAFYVFRPTDWEYPGGNPRHLKEDIDTGVSPTQSEAEICALYAQAIVKNRIVLDDNALYMRIAITLAATTILLSVFLVLAINFSAPTL